MMNLKISQWRVCLFIKTSCFLPYLKTHVPKGSLFCSKRLTTSNFSLDWPQEDAEVPGASSSGNVNGSNSDHLWEESWDDDDTNEDFSKQLKYNPSSFLPPSHSCWHITTFSLGRSLKRWKRENSRPAVKRTYEWFSKYGVGTWLNGHFERRAKKVEGGQQKSRHTE